MSPPQVKDHSRMVGRNGWWNDHQNYSTFGKTDIFHAWPLEPLEFSVNQPIFYGFPGLKTSPLTPGFRSCRFWQPSTTLPIRRRWQRFWQRQIFAWCALRPLVLARPLWEFHTVLKSLMLKSFVPLTFDFVLNETSELDFVLLDGEFNTMCKKQIQKNPSLHNHH